MTDCLRADFPTDTERDSGSLVSKKSMKSLAGKATSIVIQTTNQKHGIRPGSICGYNRGKGAIMGLR